MPEISEHKFLSSRHETFYLTCGSDDGIPIMFVHGWPDLAIGWEQQLRHFGAAGYRVIAPDMRGYGKSQVHPSPEDYTIQTLEQDMIELVDHLGIEKAVWIGHDWGTGVVWSMAQQYPERCLGVVGVCVPYMPAGFTLPEMIKNSDRAKYPVDQFPNAQWDYWRFYQTHFDDAKRAFEGNIENTVRALFRSGMPDVMKFPSPTATITARGGWFGPDGAQAPAFPRDEKVLSERHEKLYIEALSRTGFRGGDSWYLNDEANTAYAAQAKENWVLKMPVLFVHSAWDFICDTVDTPLVGPMRAHCEQLSEVILEAGHWVAQEKSEEFNSTIEEWMSGNI